MDNWLKVWDEAHNWNDGMKLLWESIDVKDDNVEWSLEGDLFEWLSSSKKWYDPNVEKTIDETRVAKDSLF